MKAAWINSAVWPFGAKYRRRLTVAEHKVDEHSVFALLVI